MMIKRDRCVCDACGVEVSGWRPWHVRFPTRASMLSDDLRFAEPVAFSRRVAFDITFAALVLM
jgi:hypothetical protein